MKKKSKIIFFIQAIHTNLQNEKSRLSSAIVACETASASISRPTSPKEQANGRESDAKIKLEDLTEKVCHQILYFVVLNVHFLVLLFVTLFVLSFYTMLGWNLCIRYS